MTPPDALTPAPDAQEPTAPAASSHVRTTVSGLPALTVLRRRADFLAASRARRQAGGSLNLQARRRDADVAPGEVRVGFTCSKKVGNAVARNRAKRRLREAARHVLARHGHPGWDYVLIGRAGATAERPWLLLLQDLEQAIARIHAPRQPRPGRSGT